MKKRMLGLALSLALFPTLVFADSSPTVTFTVRAKAKASLYGYKEGESFTFVYTLGSSFTNFDYNSFENGTNYWAQAANEGDRFWGTLGGTGLITDRSQLSEPLAYGGTVNSSITADTQGQLILLAGYDSSKDIRPMSLDGTLLGKVQVGITLQQFAFSSLDKFEDPNTYFSAYTGTYKLSGSANLYDSTDQKIIGFTVTELTISTSAVPEPTTYAAILGAFVLVVCVYRRRHQVCA